ncbi:caspase-8-like [Lampris incognitus]|uniref:caspase-8-like n=1 Tax=Lampris incognitus TaxID=2546036 RepID=UPI0024B56BAC|nr:caspase-8-like [Lampris incognitus]
MAAHDNIRRNKTALQDILSADYKRILDKVFENKLVTTREYNNLKDISREDVEGHVTRLVDKIMNKGDDICRAFLHIIKTDEDIKNTFPKLGHIEWDGTPSSNPFQSYPVAASGDPPKLQVSPVSSKDAMSPASKRKKDDQYQLATKPTGLCVIINNENFESLKRRNGTDKDAYSFAEVLSGLGFRVVMCKDQTKDQMDQALQLFASSKDFSQLQKFGVKEWANSEFTDIKEIPHHGDAFVCCILSHGDKDGIKGVDGKTIPLNKITSTFNGLNCSALNNKPKVFFIQACQGRDKHRGIAVDSSEPQMEDDAFPTLVEFIPVEADFLVAIATVENCVAYRHNEHGSWFIQSVCHQMKEYCPRGDDLMEILYRVNDEVSQKEIPNACPGIAKQIPEIRRVTLRKRLVFSPHSSEG